MAITDDHDLDCVPVAIDTGGPNDRDRLRHALVTVIAVAALVVAGAAGWLVRGGGSDAGVTAASVDAGFARDMSTHHTQATIMAGYERDHTANAALKLLAYDIETSQSVELGEMTGWLDSWGLTRESSIPQMAWMGHAGHLGSDGLMPGMATPAQLTTLETLTGRKLDILFLQLMIRHHQGGLPMAQYALTHATQPYIQNVAQKMITVQSNEIVEMEQLLRQLGGTPLPPPTQ